MEEGRVVSARVTREFTITIDHRTPDTSITPDAMMSLWNAFKHECPNYEPASISYQSLNNVIRMTIQGLKPFAANYVNNELSDFFACEQVRQWQGKKWLQNYSFILRIGQITSVEPIEAPLKP